MGIDISVGKNKTSLFANREHYGATYYWKNYGNQKGWETRKGAEITFFGFITYSGTTFSGNSFRDQTTNIISIGPPGGRISYENDFMFHFADKFYLPDNIPRADCGDAYRTTGVKFEFGIVKAGLNMFTGDPGFEYGNEDVRRDYRKINGHDTYVSHGKFNPDEYRAGVLYIQFGQVRLGRNSEKIRKIFQNKFAHDMITHGKAKWFRVLDIDPKWYFYFGSGTGNTTW